MQPNRNKFLEDLNTAVDQFSDSTFNKIISISHNDADGISSLHIIQNLLYKRYNYDYFIYNRSVSWSNYLNGILSKNPNDKTALIFTDVGSNLTELIPIIKDRKESFFILDHHEVDGDINNLEFPENLFFVNPTIHGYDGLDHIAGATLAYMFVKKINYSSIIKQGWLTVIGIAGDTLRSMDKLESFNREIYEELLTEDEAMSASETEDMFIITPAARNQETKKISGKEYRSDRKATLLTKEEIRQMLREVLS